MSHSEYMATDALAWKLLETTPVVSTSRLEQFDRDGAFSNHCDWVLWARTHNAKGLITTTYTPLSE